MNTFIKKCRIEAGLTQEKLAEKMKVTVVAVQNWEKGKTGISPDKYMDLAAVFNVPVEMLVKEMLIEADKSRPDNWPGFLFDEITNGIVDSLHLNLAQQDLFGLLYIYGSQYLEKKIIDYDTFGEDLKVVPYGFIDKVGSIQFMNQAERLHEVVRYVKADFLMKVLKQNPEIEFNIKKLPKDLICEFIDEGHKLIDDINQGDEGFEECEGLNIEVNIKKARIILPILEKLGPIHMADGRTAHPVRNDIPDELLTAALEIWGYHRRLFNEGYYKQPSDYSVYKFRHELESVTDFKNIAEKGQEECWAWSINEKGRELLRWLKE